MLSVNVPTYQVKRKFGSFRTRPRVTNCPAHTRITRLTRRAQLLMEALNFINEAGEQRATFEKHAKCVNAMLKLRLHDKTDWPTGCQTGWKSVYTRQPVCQLVCPIGWLTGCINTQQL
jgi:hypothetical protein